MAVAQAIVPALEVLVVEDDPFFRRVVCDSIARLDNQWMFLTAGTAQEALEAISQKDNQIGLALIDLGLPDGDGLDVIRALHRSHPNARILVISGSADEQRVLAAVRLGAVGYIVKGDANLSINRAVQQVLDGMHPLSMQLAGYFLKLVEKEDPNKPIPDETLPKVTRREIELLRHFANGDPYGEAAQKMGISLATAQTHARNLYRKLGVHSGLQALAKAKRHGLL